MDIGWYTYKFNELIKILDNVRNGCDTIPKWRVIKGNDDLMAIHLGYEAVKSIWDCDYPSALLFKKELEQAMKDYEKPIDTSADNTCVFIHHRNTAIALPDYIKLHTAYHKFIDRLDETLKGKENEKMNMGSEYEKMLGIIVAAVGNINEGNSADDKIITDLKRYANAHNIMEIGYAADCMREHIELGTPETYFDLLMIELDDRSSEILPQHKTIWKHIVNELFIMVWGKEYTYDTTETRNVCYDSDLYQKEALRTEAGMLHGGKFEERLENGLMGLNGESGECIDILKKHLFQGHPLDFTKLAEELGDVAWYLAVSADALGCRLSEIFQMNIEKLRKRYPDGFEVDKSVNREDD